MKYKIYQSSVKQKDREEFNRKLLKLIDNKETEKYGITGDDVFSAYCLYQAVPSAAVTVE